MHRPAAAESAAPAAAQPPASGAAAAFAAAAFAAAAPAAAAAARAGGDQVPAARGPVAGELHVRRGAVRDLRPGEFLSVTLAPNAPLTL